MTYLSVVTHLSSKSSFIMSHSCRVLGHALLVVLLWSRQGGQIEKKTRTVPGALILQATGKIPKSLFRSGNRQ